MTTGAEIRRISYVEHRILNQLMHSHIDQLSDKLHAMVVFGDIITVGDTYDVDMLEIVEGWKGDRVAEFTSTVDLPLRGTLRLYFLNASEFEKPDTIPNDEMKQWVERLIEKVRQGHEVIYENPPGYIRDGMNVKPLLATLLAPGSGELKMDNPFTLAV